MIWNKVKNSTENDYIDFKMKWYDGVTAKIDLIHDILCFSNSLSDNPERYIIIGIKENKITKEKFFVDVSEDSNQRTSEDLIQLLRNYMTVIPNIEVIRELIGDNYIDIIKIIPKTRELPYVLNCNIECKYKLDNGKEKIKSLIKNGIYSRDSSCNTPKSELCSKATLEELYARKRGEHLPVLERFALYLDDIDNWKHPQSTNGDTSENAYYYTRNHKFKIVRNVDNEELHRTIFEVIDYYQLLIDTCLGENYWKYRTEGTGACYDDYYSPFSVELWADNTLIEVYDIVSIYLKHYNFDKYKQGFYIPDRACLFKSYNSFKNKEELEKTIEWKICKLLFKFDLYPESVFKNKDASIILNELNYDYLSNPSQYLKKNKALLFKPAINNTCI